MGLLAGRTHGGDGLRGRTAVESARTGVIVGNLLRTAAGFGCGFGLVLLDVGEMQLGGCLKVAVGSCKILLALAGLV